MEEMQRAGEAVSIHTVSGHPTPQASVFSSLESHWTTSSWVLLHRHGWFQHWPLQFAKLSAYLSSLEVGLEASVF